MRSEEYGTASAAMATFLPELPSAQLAAQAILPQGPSPPYLPMPPYLLLLAASTPPYWPIGIDRCNPMTPPIPPVNLYRPLMVSTMSVSRLSQVPLTPDSSPVACSDS